MKINRSSWHYRFRAWALREDGVPSSIEPEYRAITLGGYIIDILVLGIMAMPLRIISRLTRTNAEIEFYNDKEER